MAKHNRFDDIGLFRPLTPEEEAEFRAYAHEHPEEAAYRLQTDTLCLLHPVVRDEWKRIGLLSDEDLQS
jgi:hypothetical protein